MYTKNYKTLKKEIKKYTSEWKDTLCSQAGRINTVKMFIIPKAIYRCSSGSIKIPMTFFTELEQTILKFMEPQKTLNSQSNLDKEQNQRGIMLSDLKPFYKAVGIKAILY